MLVAVILLMANENERKVESKENINIAPSIVDYIYYCNV